jgi:hypothetical protein
MGINTNFRMKNLRVNTSWKRFYVTRDITIERQGTFPSTHRFFTIGSCFANELRHALEERNITVLPKINPSIHHLFPEEFKKEVSWGKWDERAQLQFYNTFSIRQEFEKAFGIWRQADNDYIRVEHGGEVKYWDAYRRALYTRTPEEFAEIKSALDHSLADAIHSADAIVITLGMTETFFRKDNGLAMCQYNRFLCDHAIFRATTYEENFANVDRICELYFGQYPDRKIVLTVSPVGLAQTFTETDVVVANMESKSILRAVAGAIARKWPNVLYWPSYEIVMWNENSWQVDLRHVHPDRVASIMDAFVECHIQGIATNASAELWDERSQRIEKEIAIKREAVLKAAELKAAEQRRLNAEKERRRAEALRLKEQRIAEALSKKEKAIKAMLSK